MYYNKRTVAWIVAHLIKTITIFGTFRFWKRNNHQQSVLKKTCMQIALQEQMFILTASLKGAQKKCAEVV